MSKVTHAMVWNADNVSSFRGYDINSAGEVELSEAEGVEFLNEMYGTVEVCGGTFDAGRALLELDPEAFRQAISEYESSETEEFESQLENEDESGIVFAQYEPFEIDDEETEEDDE